MPRAIIQQLVLLRSAFQRVLQDVFTTLLPAAVLSCLKIHGAPQVASLVTGAKGTGKTTFLQTMSRLLHHNIVTHSHVLILDCATLKALPLEQVLLRLSEAFNSCRGYPTGLICLDNLDVLCPAGKESGAGTLRDERSSVISLHLELLLKDVHNRLNRKSNDRANPVATPDVAVPYVRERLLHDRLQSAIYVLATADGTSNIWPSLLSDFAFRRVIPLDTLSESAKLQVLAGALGDLGMTLQVPSSSHQEDLLVGALQGYRLADVHNLAKRVCFSVLQRGHRRALQEGVPTAVGMVATTEDLLTAAESYQPISSSSQASSAKRGGVAAAAVSGVSWRDVSAYDTVKCSILDTIKTPLIYAKLFRNCPIKLPRSVLLYGPPGCGKTLLAQAAGSEFGRGFIAVRGPELLDKYIGASEKAVRDLFQQARDRNRACLIFFDEFESLAPRRGKDNTGVTDRIVNQLLTFIDGVESTMSGTGGGGGGGGGGGDDDSEDGDDREGMSGDSGGGAGQIFIMAATSRPDLIDPALLRPGRIEKHIYVGLPDQSERQEILRAALSRLSVNLDSVHSAVEAIVSDKKAPQLSAADWKAVVNTAFLAATHDFIDASKSHTISKKVDKVSITEKHLRAAYAETKPSVSVADLQYYDSIYARFGHKATAEGVASKKSATIDDAALRQSYH